MPQFPQYIQLNKLVYNYYNFGFTGELNAIASFISTIYLCAYALLNLCTFHIAYFKPLGWRPSYKVINSSKLIMKQLYLRQIYIDYSSITNG